MTEVKCPLTTCKYSNPMLGICLKKQIVLIRKDAEEIKEGKGRSVYCRYMARGF